MNPSFVQDDFDIPSPPFFIRLKNCRLNGENPESKAGFSQRNQNIHIPDFWSLRQVNNGEICLSVEQIISGLSRNKVIASKLIPEWPEPQDIVGILWDGRL